MLTITIKLRLIATMAFMGLMLIIGGGMGILGVQSSNNAMREIFLNQLPSTIAIDQAQILLIRARTQAARVISHPDAAGAADILKRSEGFIAESGAAWKKYLSLPQDAEEKRLSDATDAARTALIKDGVEPMLAAIKAGNKDAADTLNNEAVQNLFTKYYEKGVDLTNFQVRIAEQQYKASQDAFLVFQWIAILGVLGGLIAVSISAFFLLKAISNPLKTMLHQFDAIGQGDLTNHIKPGSNDEMGQLLASLDTMRQSLAQTVTVVRDGSSSIASSAQEIAAGNMDLSGRTEQQAASLEETASSMEELTATVQQNADNARQANTLALTASEIAAKGGQVVGNVVHTMSSIKESSRKIVDIIAVIDGIAFQTNILALNAAVEAARAGEQGRGFAVVATEVRNLAQRSANAAKEIKELIGDSVDKVEAGSRLVDDAGKTMSDIVVSIKGVADIMAEIAAASVEQSDGISLVNQAIAKMDEVTQQNAALVEQAAAAASSMQEQANNLNQAVGIFKVNATDQTSAPSARPLKRKPAPASHPAAAKKSAKSLTNFTTGSSSKAPPSDVRKGTAAQDGWEEF